MIQAVFIIFRHLMQFNKISYLLQLPETFLWHITTTYRHSLYSLLVHKDGQYLVEY